MADNHDKAGRSYNMSRIRSKDTLPEMIVRKSLFAKGFRFRLHVKKLPGNPDIVLAKYNTVIFINGCFWHQHPNCKKAVLPKSNVEYWLHKIEKNVIRDRQNLESLQKLNWKIIIIWECELNKKNLNLTIESVVETLRNS